MLQFSPQEAARRYGKVIRSAIANWEAKNEGERPEDNQLSCQRSYVDSARMLKRIQPAPQGRAHRIRKRSNHVTSIVEVQNSRSIMGQKDKSNMQIRLGIIKGWDSTGSVEEITLTRLLKTDKIRKYFMARLQKASVSKIVIERTLKLITLQLIAQDQVLSSVKVERRRYVEERS